MKQVFVIMTLLVLGLGGSLEAAKPIIAIGEIKTLAPKEARFARMLENHLENIIHSTGIFDRVNSSLMREQLSRFQCSDEQCLLSFAREAGISIIISGSLEDLGDHMLFTLSLFGTDVPYEGKMIYRYVVKVPLYAKHSAVESSYICEEQAGHLISGFLGEYRCPLYLEKSPDSSLAVPDEVSGVYTVYRRGGLGRLPLEGSARGEVTLDRGKVRSQSGDDILPGDFILHVYKDRSRFLKEFYYGRKKEIIFNQQKYTDVLYMLLLTGPASALMPVVSPLFGYYRTADWTGLALWGLNLAPYLYLEINGFVNYPDQFRHHKKNISRQVMTQWHFAWYFAFAGGVSLFVDAFAHDYLKTASNYAEKKSFMGNPLCAGYFALVSGGAGHFYRGHRFWGYFYFHLNNALLYLLINEFSPGERYDARRGRYVKEGINETRAYVYTGLFCALKIVEVVHAVLIKDNIRGGDVIEETTFEPLLYPDDEGLNVGIQCNYRF
ncbi:MAG TPA: hypothetical protein PK926_00435 [Spirochaetota bacterium]|nr:hypothetical protein [Spirochaetota bacterium]HPI87818.1 hypothetical protein [Spirochaetota bacterium]HPR47545.1 hypothetical protein [Spirochaetota bacterium]